MYAYKIGYWSYEGSDYCVLLHEKQFTEKDIDSLIVQAITRITNPSYLNCSYQDIHIGVVDFLVAKRGFVRLKYERQWSIFGSPSLFSEEDWEGERGYKLDLITKKLKKLKLTLQTKGIF